MPNLEQQLPDYRMNVKMLVRVDMVQHESRGTECFELGGDFGRELALCPAVHRDIYAGPHHILAKAARRFDEIGDRICGKRRDTIHQHKMQAHSQIGKAARAGDGIGRGGARHHQAGSRQNPVAMGPFDRCIHFRRGAEIIRRDDQLFQAWLRRARRKWKNSTPSRSRRFIISGLAIISRTIDAIFDGRK